jgi:WD40 repeat protein
MTCARRLPSKKSAKDVKTGKQVAGFEGHKDAVSKVAFSPDGAYAISGGWDKTARQWKLPE